MKVAFLHLHEKLLQLKRGEGMSRVASEKSGRFRSEASPFQKKCQPSLHTSINEVSIASTSMMRLGGCCSKGFLPRTNYWGFLPGNEADAIDLFNGGTELKIERSRTSPIAHPSPG